MPDLPALSLNDTGGRSEVRANESSAELSEPPNRYPDENKALTHEQMFYEERGRRLALEQNLIFLQERLMQSDRAVVSAERGWADADAKCHQLLLQMQQLQSQNEHLRVQCLQLEKNAGVHDASANESVNGEIAAMRAESSSTFTEVPKGADTPPRNEPVEPGHDI